VTDSLKVWYILRKRAIFYREFSIGREVFGGGGRLFIKNLTRGKFGGIQIQIGSFTS